MQTLISIYSSSFLPSHYMFIPWQYFINLIAIGFINPWCWQFFPYLLKSFHRSISRKQIFFRSSIFIFYNYRPNPKFIFFFTSERPSFIYAYGFYFSLYLRVNSFLRNFHSALWSAFFIHFWTVGKEISRALEIELIKLPWTKRQIASSLIWRGLNLCLALGVKRRKHFLHR